MSPYLFILCVEIFALKINNNKLIKGIFIGNHETKLLQYADDTILFLDSSKTSLTETLNVLNNLGEASGLNINLNKSNLFPLGPFVSHKPPFVNDIDLNYTLGPLDFLGISFTHNGDDLFRLNYVTKLSRLKNILNLWSTRNLTPIGRNTIVKTFGLSQLVYLFLVLPNPPNSFITELNRIIFNFIWSNNPDKVKRSSIINPVNQGGLKVIHIESFISSLKCTWISRYCDSSRRPWKNIF